MPGGGVGDARRGCSEVGRCPAGVWRAGVWRVWRDRRVAPQGGGEGWRAGGAGELRVRYFWRESDTLKKFNDAQ